MKTTTLPVLITCSALVCACGSSSDPVTFDDYVAEAVALEEQIIAEDTASTDPSTLPTTGTAQYSGVASATMSDDTEIRGRMTLDADFADNTVSGSLSDFVDQDSNGFEGTLDISEADIDRSGGSDDGTTFDADISGTLTNFEDEDFTVDGEINGGFGGEEYQYIVGFIEGTASNGTEVLELNDGEFITEKQ